MATKKNQDILTWWREARFGMFIHWGVYAVPAGAWKGKPIPSLGEWIMYNARIPVAEYEKLAGKFNPVQFNAREWVKLAKDAGMKYLVITAKHHDGFAMYDSPSDPYNIAAATPWGKDPMKALAAECRKAGIRMCFYYSQDQDWHEPGASGNTWDWPASSKKQFATYLEKKVKPQLKELLTQYGPIGLIWFDTPKQITKAQSLDLKAYVHKLQPDCLVSGRVGNDVGDYGSMGDNQIPAGRVKGAWETPATTNDTWAFKKDDKNWKSTEELLQLLVDLASKGVNYLLNVGPTAKGIIPAASAKRLRDIGAWLKTNGEAIYGTDPSPFPYELEWGRITTKPGKMYLLFHDWPGKNFSLSGLKNAVTKAYLLADRRVRVGVEQARATVTLELPKTKPDKHVSVVVLEFAGELKVATALAQQNSGAVYLPGHLAKIQNPTKGAGLVIDRSGIVTGWVSKQPRLSCKLGWKFTITDPGSFDVYLDTAALAHPRVWKPGHEVALTIAGSKLAKKLRKDAVIESPRTLHFQEVASKLGTITIEAPGAYTAELRATQIKQSIPGGLAVSSLRLVKRG